jgi:hypothetical protein
VRVGSAPVPNWSVRAPVWAQEDDSHDTRRSRQPRCSMGPFGSSIVQSSQRFAPPSSNRRLALRCLACASLAIEPIVSNAVFADELKDWTIAIVHRVPGRMTGSLPVRSHQPG